MGSVSPTPPVPTPGSSPLVERNARDSFLQAPKDFAQRIRRQLVLRGIPADHVEWYLDGFRAEVLNEAADKAEGLRQFEKVSGPRRSAQVSENVGILRVADALRAMAAAPAAAPVPDETAGDETEFAVRWPDGSLTPVSDRAHGLRAIASARRAEPGTVLIQRTCTPWTEVQS